MTPNEKANELINRFVGIKLSQLKLLVDGIRLRLAKESALICVDEMLSLGSLVGGDLSDSFYIYWNEVRKEINNFNQL